MLLVTIGYNAEKAGLVGSTWASKTNALADELVCWMTLTLPLPLLARVSTLHS